MKTYSETEVLEYLPQHLKGWSFDKGKITRDFEFEDFQEAFSFMTHVALAAESADHHPEWSNVYNRVRIALNTHSAGGITQKDYDLAAHIDLAFRNTNK